VIRPRALLVGAITAFAAGFSALGVLRHDAFSTGRFDLGNMVQAVWSTAHGHPLQVTSLSGEQVSRLGVHFDPILVAFAPLWWLWPHPSLLVVVQATALALGALPVFWLGLRHLGSERLALALALAYLLAPPTQWLALNEFHPAALATPLLLLAQVTTRPVSGLPLASFGIAVSCTAPPTNTSVDAGLTVTDATGAVDAATVIADVPLWPSLVAVIVAVPANLPVTSPLVFTVATPVFEVAHVTTRPLNGLPLASLGVAVSCTV